MEMYQILVIFCVFISVSESVMDTKTATACEGSILSIECSIGETILIKQANYGRTNDGTCPHSAMSNKNCYATSSEQQVIQTCNNQQRCSIAATNGVFGDPCVGTYKYLTVQYLCMPVTKISTSCEGNTLSIECPAGEKILIRQANYGRTDGTTCVHSAMSNRNCHSASSAQKVSETCNNQQRCSIAVTNGVFGDPCVGTYKYLTVKYECIADEAKNIATACEGNNLSIECPTGEMILIKQANYGRTNGATCIHSLMSNRNCYATGSVQKVAEACNNQKRCSIHAANGIFGDPCLNTYKYLTVEYECITAGPCNEGKFQCYDGTCIADSQLWNGFRDCPSGEDEIGFDYESEYACESHTLNINCRRGEIISVVSANYGRLSKKICSHALMGNTNCRAGNSLQIVKDRCNGGPTCSISSSNDVFGDPCVNVYKYTEVHYQCLQLPNCTEEEFQCNNGACINKAKICDGQWDCKTGEDEHGCDYLTEYACEHSTIEINCKKHHVIKILNANYGRQLPYICTYQTKTDCLAPISKKKMEDKCNGQNKCSMSATNGEFGDPCVGTIKYLSVNYKCQGIEDNVIPQVV